MTFIKLDTIRKIHYRLFHVQEWDGFNLRQNFIYFISDKRWQLIFLTLIGIYYYCYVLKEGKQILKNAFSFTADTA